MTLDPLRVAMLGSFPPQAQGVQDYCRALGVALGQCCHVHAIGFRRMYPAVLFPGVKEAMDPTKAPMAAPGLTVEHRLTWSNPLGWLRAGFATECDVFHAQWWSLPLFPVTWTLARAMKRRGKPVFVTAHNVLPHERSGAYIRASARLFALSDCVIVHSEHNLAQLRAQYGLPEAKTVQVPMGVTLSETPRVAPAEARARLGLPAGKRYVLCFGTIRPYKGLEVLLRALARLPEEVHVIIAGKPWEDWAPHARLIAEQGLEHRVHRYLGYIPEARVPLFFGAADVIALPYTHFDAQSAVGAQALPWRKPLVVSRTGALPDWVGGDPAYIVPPGDPEALAARLAALFAVWPETQTAFDAVAQRVLDRVSWDGIAAHMIGLYRARTGERLQDREA